MPKLSEERLKELAKLSGGIGLLILIGLFLSHDADPSIPALISAVDCSTSGGTDICEEETIAGGTIRIEADPATVVEGGTSFISWDGGDAPLVQGELLCLGNLSGTCVSNPTPYHTVSASGVVQVSHDTFMYGGVLYSVLLSGSSSGTNVRTYRWMPSGTNCPAEGGWGNGTTCGTAVYNMSAAYAAHLDAHVINGHPYLQVRAITYKWTPSATGCSAGGWGNGTICGNANYYSGISYQSSGGQVENIIWGSIFESGGTYYVGLTNSTNSLILYKWQLTGTGCPAGGNWGNGPACNTTPWMSGLGSQTFGAVSKFTVQGNDHIIVNDQSNASTRLFRWTPAGTNCPAGGGWGNGTTACRTPAQTFRSNTAIALLTGSLYTKVIEGGSPYPYLVIGASDGSNQTVQARLYKWHPAGTAGCPSGGGFGNSTTCGDSSVQSLGTNTGEPGVFTVGSKAFVGYGGQIRQLLPASNCLGTAAACSTGTGIQSVSISEPALFMNGAEPFVLGAAGGNSVTFKVIDLPPNPPSCRIVWDDTTGSGEFADHVSGSDVETPPLMRTTTYTLSCVGLTEQVTVPVTVVDPPVVTISATDDSAAEGGGSGEFTITRTDAVAGGNGAPVTIELDVNGDGTCGSGCWTVPSDWNSANNTIEVIGGGGGGASEAAGNGAGGAGGGAYSRINNLTLTPGNPITFNVGAPGAADTALGGGDTYFNGTSLANSSVGADGGNGATTEAAATGGAATNGKPLSGGVRYSGGNGGTGNDTSDSSGGGGGAAGPNGNGGAGGNGAGGTAVDGSQNGGGGGGNGGRGTTGGYPGGNGGVALAGAGGNNYLNVGGGAPVAANNGNPGSNGGGGAGGDDTFTGGAGGHGQEWSSVYGSGGGGGGAGDLTAAGDNGGAGGRYGAGGGGGVLGGVGAGGLIVIRYTPFVLPTPELDVVIARSGSATNGSDYQSISTTQTIPAGASSVTVALNPLQDSLVEGSETVSLEVQDPGDWRYVPGSPSSDFVTISDDDAAPPPTGLPTLTSCTGSTAAGVSCSFGANPSRVRKDTQTTLSWYIPAQSPTVTCNITATPAISGFGPLWVGTGVDVSDSQQVTIPRITTFTLTCTDGSNTTPPAQKTVGILPTYQEI